MPAREESVKGSMTAVAITASWSEEEVAASWKTLLVLGLLIMTLGLLAIVVPHVASIAAELMVGALLFLIGLLEGIHAAHMRGRRGQGWRISGAVLGLGVGTLLLLFPTAGVISLTLVVSIFLVLGGMLRSGMALQLRPLPGWGWLLASGLLGLLLGLFILLTLPVAGLWVLGLLLGIDLLFGGCWLVFLALAGRRWTQRTL